MAIIQYATRTTVACSGPIPSSYITDSKVKKDTSAIIDDNTNPTIPKNFAHFDISTKCSFTGPSMRIRLELLSIYF
jgi:hypothetical protein